LNTRDYPLTVVPGYFATQPGIQIGVRLPSTATEEEMRFVRQIGVEWVVVSLDHPREHSVEAYRALKQKFADQGLKIYRLANHNCHNMEEVTLNLPGRDEKIAEYLNYIRNLGAVGIHYATYAHMGNGIWTTGDEEIRGGATSRAFRLDKPGTGYTMVKSWTGALTHGRRYSEDEIWDNYQYFIRQVAPVAEQAGVFIGIHPDDPPVYEVGGVPRCIFGNFAGYARAIEIANSPNIGVCLCVGCWLEGGERMGKSVVETIRYLGRQKKLFKVHFRNVTAPLPAGFAETFLDDGYGDMYSIMRALREVEFDGLVISDHIPNMVGGRLVAESLAVGYIKGLREAVNREFRSTQ